MDFDLVIRGGDLADGRGGPLRRADVAVKDGRIAEVGDVHGRGREEIDARGLLVTPGFVDVHTHYDGQVAWDSRMQPSSWHGVTTAVMGNCGVGFAPVHADDRDRLIELMEGIEDIPGAALHVGLDWRWESFREYLDSLDGRPYDIDVAAQLPHGALRMYVMGERAARLEPATPEDIAQMRHLAAEAVRAGAIGFSTSRSINHKSIKGDPTPTLRATEAELTGIAMGLADAGKGVFQFISDFDVPSLEEEFAMLRRVAAASGRPMSFTLLQRHSPTASEDWRRLLELTREAVADGLQIRAQVAPRPVGVLLGLQGSRNPFTTCPSYKAIAALPLDERVARMRTPEVRAQLLREIGQPAKDMLSQRLTAFERIFPLGDVPNYEPAREQSIAAIAQRAGRAPADVAYDEILRSDGRAFLLAPFANYADYSLDACRDMIADANTVIGLGDGGAHVGVISDASFPTFLLSHWGRDRPTGRFDVAWLVRRQSLDTARTVGLFDRGVVAPGYKADLNVIDMNRLAVSLPEIAHDLPAGGAATSAARAGLCGDRGVGGDGVSRGRGHRGAAGTPGTRTAGCASRHRARRAPASG